jgi:hypothetical protein
MKRIAFCLALCLVAGGCAYRHYLGVHGPSIRRFPEIHAGARLDEECLACHLPSPVPRLPEMPRRRGVNGLLRLTRGR